MAKAEDTASDTARSRRSFKAIVAILIAGTSVLGSLIAYRASQHSGSASGLEQQASQQLLRKRQLEGSVDSYIKNDQRLFTRYQEHVRAWRHLTAESEDLRKSSPRVAEVLEEEAKGELTLARRLSRFFTYPAPAPSQSDEDGALEYNADAARRDLIGLYARIGDFQPQRMEEAAAKEADVSLHLSGVAALSILALFFLTLAEITKKRRAHLLAGLGGVALLTSLVLFILIEVAE